MPHRTPIRTLVVAAVLCLPATRVLAGLGQWTSIGPSRGFGRSIAVDPTNASTVYASIDGTVFKSTDAAASWVAAGTGLPDDALQHLVVDPSTPTRLYVAAGYDGVFVSADSAGSWSAANTGLPIHSGTNSAIRLAVDPATPGTAYVAFGPAGLFKTTNGGASWSPSAVGLGSAVALAVALDPSTPTTLYVGVHQFGLLPAALFKSTDGGANWSPTPLTAWAFGNTEMFVLDVVVDPSAPANVYALAYDDGFRDHGPFIAKSSDGGASFTRVGPPGVAFALAVDPTNPARLLAGTEDGVFTSLDGGGTWSRTSVGIAALLERKISALAIDPSDPATVYAAPGEQYFGDGVYKTTDGAAHWASANVGLSRTGSVGDVTLAPDAPTQIFASTGGLYVSSDAGSHWAARNLGLPHGPKRVAIDPTTPDTVYAADGVTGIYKSTDRGITWASAGLDSLGVLAIVIDPTTPSTLYAATYGGVFRSSDGAASWNAASTGLADLYVQALAIDPGVPATLYAGTPAGVYRSTNAGATWTATALVLADGPNVLECAVLMLAVDPSAAVVAYTYISTFVPPVSLSYEAHLQKSTDGGASWTPTETGLGGNGFIKAIAFDPVTPTTRYVGGSGGISRSIDGGDTWTAYNAGLPAVTSVTALAIDPSRPSWVYAATSRGLERIEGPCAVDADCTDENPCTADACNVGDGSCANAAVPNGGACDDGDACSAASTCQAGTCAAVAPPPVCDDAVVCTDDVCSPLTGSCVAALRANGGLCDDGSTCTTEDQCGAGVCAGTPVPCDACRQCQEGLGCVATPRAGCAGPSAKGGSLSLRESDDGRGQIKWTWKGAGTTTKTDFGNPLGATTYSLCLYDTDAGTTRILKLPSRENICALDNCWNETSRGYKVKGGYLHTFALSASSSGKGTIRIVGKGLFLADFPPALPLVKDPKVVMQVQREDSPACWEAEYTTSRVSTATHFEAKTP
jgi:photosystem II stability/assembly factor-like uncharacterized protein